MEARDNTILYVDDDHSNRVVMKHNLGAEFSLLLADSGPAALEILAREPVAVLLTDQRMPGMSGVDLAARVRDHYPHVIRVIIAACSDLDATVDAINRARVARFIKKPWTREELLAVMRESLQSHRDSALLHKLQEKLSQMDRLTAIAVMGSSIAHDLRQPLALVVPTLDVVRADLKGLLELDLPVPGPDRVADLIDAVEDARTSVGRLKLIIESLLKSLRGRTETREPLDLRCIVESALSIMRGAVVTRARLVVELPPAAVMVTGSEGQLFQLLVNLILNAVQSLPRGTLSMSQRVTVRVHEDGARGFITVEDTGSGIAPGNLPQIFTPFFTTKGNDGTGLGLAICKQIVDEGQGTIEVQSVVGRGSTFTVALPLTT